MRSVQDHLAAVLAAVGPVPPLDVVLHDAVGCILAADVVATHDLPSLSVASRDGYAVAAHDTSRSGYATRDAAAGRARRPARARADRCGWCPGPRCGSRRARRCRSGADAVVPLEETDRGTARVSMQRPAVAGQHVRPAGSDVRAGDVVLAAGTRLGARQLALAAAMGRGRLRVHPTPRVVLLSVGDELVEPGSTRNAPGHRVRGRRARARGGRPRRRRRRRCGSRHLPDDRAVLREALEDQLVRADLIILTGGLSELDARHRQGRARAAWAACGSTRSR